MKDDPNRPETEEDGQRAGALRLLQARHRSQALKGRIPDSLQSQVSPNAISEAALQVCSREELTQMPKQLRLGLMHLISQRLNRQPPPTQAELQGIKELVLEHAWHPALGSLPQASPNGKGQF